MNENWEVLVNGEWVPLVPAVHPDACQDCLEGRWIGYDHPECLTLAPELVPRVRY